MSSEQEQFLEQLYCDTYWQLLLYASRLLQDTNQAEDVVQNAFFEAITHVDALMRHPNPVGWLILTLKHKVQEENRRRRRYLLRFLSLEELAVEPAAESGEPEQMQGMDEADILAAAQTCLTEEEWRLLSRCVIDGADSRTVAKELGLLAPTVRKRLERIRRKLRRAFDRYT